ncbi:nitrite reductase (NADH) small subunit [Saccharopolyspora lacisalsi]|uniref:Nitrite reductase (NADH) small subunit n=1 Tax=Halosaccharopolyspora lacisalsi TaxID=1000566 RepID=A0A839E1F0_9PSEU|nr:nitrite reductase small subunit NirD [Halosaccharopolyspora lacisalsi]MBA8824788.1 nitrite reductase (NADH) small subunit [Halosaccharopolyspora lacisalsi]
MKWHRVCTAAALPPEYGVAALLGEDGAAVFRTAGDGLFAVGNVDPFSGAGVISRGIVGDRDGEPTVSSPMHKHVFSLRTGTCLDEPSVALPTYPVRYRGGDVEVGLT